MLPGVLFREGGMDMVWVRRGFKQGMTYRILDSEPPPHPLPDLLDSDPTRELAPITSPLDANCEYADSIAGGGGFFKLSGLYEQTATSSPTMALRASLGLWDPAK